MPAPVDKSFFEKNGYCVVWNFLTPTEIDVLKQRAGQLVEEFQEPESKSHFDTDKDNHLDDDYFKQSGGNISFFYEKAKGESKANSINKIGHALHDCDEVFQHFSRQDKVKKVVSELGIDEALLLQSMYIFKQPFIGGEVTLHQDSTFLMAKPNTLIGLWFALDDATEENGCLWALPGAHTRATENFYVRENDELVFKENCKADWDMGALVPLEVKKGSLIVLHGNLPHMSHENRSPHPRHAYTLHLIDANSQFLPENWLQRAQPFSGF